MSIEIEKNNLIIKLCMQSEELVLLNIRIWLQNIYNNKTLETFHSRLNTPQFYQRCRFVSHINKILLHNQEPALQHFNRFWKSAREISSSYCFKIQINFIPLYTRISPFEFVHYFLFSFFIKKKKTLFFVEFIFMCIYVEVRFIFKLLTFYDSAIMVSTIDLVNKLKFCIYKLRSIKMKTPPVTSPLTIRYFIFNLYQIVYIYVLV